MPALQQAAGLGMTTFKETYANLDCSQDAYQKGVAAQNPAAQQARQDQWTAVHNKV